MLAFVCWLLAAFLVLRAAHRRRELARAHKLAHGGGAVALAGLALVLGPSAIVLAKVAARMVMPLGLLWSVAWLLALLFAARGARSRAAVALGAAVALTLAGNEPLGEAVMASLERPYPDDPLGRTSADAPLDVLFVLGGGVDVGPQNQPELGPSGDRVTAAARLYHRGRVKLLAASGTTIAGIGTAYDNIGATLQLWRDLGVPENALIALPGVTRNTHEEAQAAAAFVRSRGFTRIGLLTSAWHMRRAHRLFAGAGLDVVPLVGDHRGRPTWDGLYSLVPTGWGAFLLQKSCWEWLGAVTDR
jgi:uncharacterized SAM-binding protein YcdF (DUF218 family)